MAVVAQGTGGDDHRERELLRAIWDLHAVSSTVWLWRGQANAAHDITPGIHTRIKAAGALDDTTVVTRTTDLLGTVRHTRLDQHEGVRLTDLPLLALIQHHGAATPLLDVSLDPLVALYMAVVSPNAADDRKDGVVFAIRRPAMVIDPFTSEAFEHLYERLPANAVAMYTAPMSANDYGFSAATSCSDGWTRRDVRRCHSRSKTRRCTSTAPGWPGFLRSGGNRGDPRRHRRTSGCSRLRRR